MEQFPSHSEDQGFTLANFINTWAKRWKLFASILIIFLVAGVVQFKSRPLLPFVHRTTFEIGVKGDGTPIEPLSSVKSKFDNVYIPTVLVEHAKEEGYEDARYFVKVVDGEGLKGAVKESEGKESIQSDLVIESTGYENDTPALLEIHKRIAKRFVDDHVAQAVQIKKELAQEKLRAEHKLKELEEAEARLPQKRKVLDEKAELVKRQITATEDLLNTAEKDRARALISAATKESIDQSLVTTFLLLDNTMAKHRETLHTLEEQLFVQIPQERTAIDVEAAQLKRSQIEQQQVIDTIVFQIDNFRSTRVSLEPSRLPRLPLSGVLYQTLAIFGGVGFLLGLFLVVFVEFAVNVRAQARQKR